MSSIPDLSNYVNITTLNASHNYISTINIKELPPNLEKLILTKNNINISIDSTVIPGKIKKLFLNDNMISRFYGQNFKNITNLSLSSNKLTEFVFPPNVKKVDISGNKISKLTNFPSSLQTIDCGHNMLTTLPKINDNLIELIVNLNRLQTLFELPDTLISLDASDNLINSITSLPNKLRDLNLNNNLLPEICKLPETLNELHLDDNYFTEMPYLPENVVTVCINKNEIREFSPDEIPLSVIHLDVSYNKIHEIPLILKHRVDRFEYGGNGNSNVISNAITKYTLDKDSYSNDDDDFSHLYESDTPFDDTYFSNYNKPKYDNIHNPYSNYNNNHLNYQRNMERQNNINHYNAEYYDNYFGNDTTKYYNDTTKYNYVNINLKNPRCVSIFNTKIIDL
jgi:Leucine-rich repeat (LRR) protein